MARLADTALINDASLKLYLKLDGNSTDSSTSGLNGTDTNITYENAPFGQGAVFNGTSSKIALGTSSTLNPTSAFSIAGWVKFTSLPSAGYNTIASRWASAGNLSWTFYVDGTSNKLCMGASTNGTADLYTAGTTAMVANKWYHVAAVFNGSNFKVYLNGVQEGTPTALASIYSSTSDTVLGSQSSASWWAGNIDELAIFNKALSGAEICALAQRGIAPTFDSVISDTNTKLLYKFEETGGTSVTDSSGNSHTGTASNASILNNDFGMVGYRGVFNGSSDKITITDHADLKPTGAFSVGTWIRTTDNTTAIMGLFQSQASATSKFAGISLETVATGKVAVYSGKNTGVTVSTDFQKAQSTSYINDGKWHLVVGTWDTSNLKIYVDGVLEATTAWANAPVYQATNYVRVGCRNDTGTDATFFGGDLDEPFLLNGTALTQAQINKLYNGYQGNTVTDAGLTTNLKLYLKFDETTGTTLTDSSGNGHDGTASAASIIANNTFGKFNNRGVFVSASSNKVTITDHADLKPTGNFSVSAWIRTINKSDNKYIFQSYSENSYVAGISLKIASGTGVIYAYSGHNNGVTQGTHWQQIGGTTDVADGRWHHVVYIWDSSYLRIFVDGTQENAVSYAVAPAYAGTSYVRVGCYNASGTDSATSFWDGDIDDLALWNGTALTASQVQLLYRIQSATRHYDSLFFSQI